MTTTTHKPHSYTLQPGEKAHTVMVYTPSQLVWGDVVLIETIRPSTWLRTNAIPRFIQLHDAQVLKVFQNTSLKPASYTELLVPSSQVIAFHLKPPAADPIDYDPNEPMRKMEPVTALVGDFRFDGGLRMSNQLNLIRCLDVGREAFIGLYDLNIYLPAVPAFGQIHTPFCLVRCESLLFSTRSV